MPDHIARSEAIVEVPEPKPAISVSARFVVDRRVVELLGPSLLRNTILKAEGKVKTFLARAGRRAYGQSGLKKRSGNLFRWISNPANIVLSIDVKRTGTIEIFAAWIDQPIYARVHMFGHKMKVTPKQRAFLHRENIIHLRAKTKFIEIPARPYMRFDVRSRNEIEGAFSRVLDDELAKQERKAVEPKVARAVARRRLTPHRVRQALFRAGFVRGEARPLATQILKSDRPRFLLKELIRLRKAGFLLIRGKTAPQFNIQEVLRGI